MDVEKQMPLMNNNLDNVKASDCCGGHSDESSAKPIRQSCCNGGCSQSRSSSFPKTRHQSSVDSGYGYTLDPISENQEYYANGDCKPGTEDVFACQCQCQHRKKLTSVAAEQVVQCCKDQSHKCNCADSNTAPQSCWGRNGYSHIKEETEFMAGRACIRSSSRSTMPVPTKCNSCPSFAGDLQQQSAAPKGERFRSVSGSSCSDEGFCNHGRCDQVIAYDPDAESNEVAKGPPKFQRCRCWKILLIGVIVTVLVGVAIALGISYFVHDGKMKKMEAKIAELEQEIGQVAKSAPSSFEALTSRGADVRPRMHLKLKSQSPIPVNPWNERTLQWIPDIQGGVGIEYDDSKKSLIMHEAGVYFVYNQIYVLRHVPQDAGVMTSLSNHTMFHTIYKRPFNYSLKRKPRPVTESALSSCWSSNAGRQVHSSYQGIIVKMKRNEELLVALEDYDESMDTLDPSTTFFGAFRL